VLTASEKRFIKSWEEQRTGGRVKFYLLYIILGTFIATLVISFLTQVLGMGLPENLVLIVICSFCIVTIATILGWQRNEKRFKRIIQREIREGMRKDAEGM
jgi:threonine/homoserine/homoserine lactone efflux protein